MKKNIQSMKKMSWAEAVSPGHPDKTADIISEYILDKYLEKDPNTRYAVEVMVKGNRVVLGGEVTSKYKFSDEELAAFVYQALGLIGYTPEYAEAWGEGNTINPDEMTVYINITTQSPEIGQGVDNKGWGDQGVFYGFADPTGDKYMMPLAHSYAVSLCHKLYIQARTKGIGGLDIKTEIIMDGTWISKIIAAVPCRDAKERELVLKSIEDWAEKTEEDLPFIPTIILNGTGDYVMHSAVADCGVTGRKLAVDFYSGAASIGGGCPWTKDYTKADLSLNLLARNKAKELAREHNKPVTVELACCIGKSTIEYQALEPCGDIIENGTLDVTPGDLKEKFGLDKPIFTSACLFGLFGEFQQDKNWEKI